VQVLATQAIQAKIAVLGLSLLDIEEALFALTAPPIEDRRPVHRTSPPTVWFVSATSDDRTLFVAGIWDEEMEAFIVRTARDATDEDIARWNDGRW
jgi:hypothetical protein